MPLRGQIMGRTAGEGAWPPRWPICAEVEPQGLGARRLLPRLLFCFVVLAGVSFSSIALAETSRIAEPNWEACRAMSGVATVLEEQPRPEDAVLNVPVRIAVYPLKWTYGQRPLRVLTLTAGRSESEMVYRDILADIEREIFAKEFEFHVTFQSFDPNDWPRVFLQHDIRPSLQKPGTDGWFLRHILPDHYRPSPIRGPIYADERRGRYEFICFGNWEWSRPRWGPPTRERLRITWVAASRNGAVNGTGVRIRCRDIDPLRGAPLPNPTMSCELELLGPLHQVRVRIASPSNEALVQALRWVRATFPNFWPPGYL
jgi:hypothetical protein